MLAYTYKEKGKFELIEKSRPVLKHDRDAIVRVTLSSICTSDLHIKHGSVPRAVPGITVGHEMVGVVEEIGSAVTTVKPGDRVTVNVETFCGSCFFCQFLQFIILYPTAALLTIFRPLKISIFLAANTFIGDVSFR